MAAYCDFDSEITMVRTVLLIAVSCLLVGAGRPSNAESVEEYIALSIAPPSPAVSWERLLEWAVSRQKAAEQLLQTNPDQLMDQVCVAFAEKEPSEAFCISLACSSNFLHGFLRTPTERSDLSKYRKLEKWREVQYGYFLRNELFRMRYMQLSVWECSALRHRFLNEQFESDPIADCIGLDDAIEECFRELSGKGSLYGEVPHVFNLHALFFMQLSSREDMIEAVAKGDNIKDVFPRWYAWFQEHKLTLVQRRDYLGWVAIEATGVEDRRAPGVHFRFPRLAVPSEAIPGLTIKKHELRRCFSY